MERLTHTGTVHLAVQSAMSRGHVSGLLFRRVCGFREKKKGGEEVASAAGMRVVVVVGLISIHTR